MSCLSQVLCLCLFLVCLRYCVCCLVLVVLYCHVMCCYIVLYCWFLYIFIVNIHLFFYRGSYVYFSIFRLYVLIYFSHFLIFLPYLVLKNDSKLWTHIWSFKMSWSDVWLCMSGAGCTFFVVVEEAPKRRTLSTWWPLFIILWVKVFIFYFILRFSTVFTFLLWFVS